jgi:two-component system, NtrC family, sensor kinase
MGSRDKAAGKAGSAQGKTVTPKSRNAPKVGRHRDSLAAAAETKVAVLTRERDKALEQQKATSEVLRAISDAPTDAASTLGTIAESVARLLDVTDAEIIMRVEGNLLRCVTKYGPSRNWPVGTTRTLSRDWVTGRAVIDRIAVHVADLQAAECEFSQGAAFARQYGHRTTLAVPLLREGSAMGAILIRRMEVKPFTDSQIELVSSFASQAVIAIENARLFNEVQAKTRELHVSLEYQIATADVLNVISRSTTNVQPVFDAIATSAARLFAPCETTLTMVHDGQFHWRATASLGRPVEAIERTRAIYPVPFDVKNTPSARAIQERRIIEIADAMAPDTPKHTRRAQSAGEFRSITFVPLLGDGIGIGTIILTHPEAGFKLSPKQLALVQTFADQAVIAIENARLFEEVQAKTRDLTESLQQQTATADVLKVISRSAFDLESVLNTLVQSAVTLSGARSGTIFQKRGDLYHLTAQYGYTPEMLAYGRASPIAPGIGSNVGRTAMAGDVVQIPDVLADPDYASHGYQRIGNFRAMLGIPLKRDGEVEGVFSLAKPDPGPFGQRQVELVHTFADQAVIAIENARLLSELRQSLQQQTATAEVLKVISRSTFDLPAVLHALVETATRLCNADKGTITRQKDGVFYRAESVGFSEEFMDYVRGAPVAVDRHSATGRALLEGVVVHIPDVEADQDYSFTEGQRLGNFRSLLGIPMLREGVPIGAITLTRTEPRAFTQKQIELAITFADQAAIAIENVRLFDEVQARTRELAKSLDDLRTAQDRLIQTEKLASLGQLTAGIAHEIKNPLNFVNNFAALSAELTGELKDVLKPATLADKIRTEVDELTDLLKDNLDKVVQHGKRADSIVKNMLQHSREGSGEHRPADINAIVDDSLNLAYHGARAEKAGFSIALQRDFDPSVGMADVYPQEITRVLLNLISNAFYATTKRKAEAGDGFEPMVSAATKNLGDKVQIRIRDNGTGIPEEVKEKIFNPFFTTKPTGEGTGLGLSMSHDIIVKQHGGSIDVETQSGLFTDFKIVLPRTGQR